MWLSGGVQASHKPYDPRAAVKPLLVLTLVACGGSGAGIGDAPLVDGLDGPPSPPAHWVAYVGGYGDAISWYRVDATSGALAKLGEITASAPSFLAFDPGLAHVYAVDEAGSRVVAFATDPASGALTRLDDQPSGGSGPAHVTVADGHVLVANYGDGAVGVLPIAADGGVDAATQVVNAGSHAHQVVVAGAHAFVPCLGSDHVAQYTWGQGTLAADGMLATASGAGPRHLALAGDGYAYLIDETASTVMALAVDAQGHLSALQTVSTLPDGFSGTNTGAEIAVAGGYVYASNRGADDLAVFSRDATGRLTAIAHVPSGGMTPRHFSLGPDGRWLFVANQGSNNVAVFAIGADGVPVATGTSVTVQAPSFVGIAAFP